MDSPEEAPLKSEKKPKRSFIEKLKYVKDNITVEPVLACFIIPGALIRLATQNLNLDKACRVNLAYGDKVCDSLIAREGNKYLEEELAVQELIASIEVWRSLIGTVIPSFLILFLGAWSARTRKRKICIIIPIFGDVLMCLSNIFSVYFFYEIPVELTMFLEVIFPVITGGWVALYMGSFSYISDVSSVESRTFRIGVANLCCTAGGPIANALSGILLDKTGYYGVFALSGLLYLFSLIYGLLFIQDLERPAPEKGTEVMVAQDKSSGVWGFIKSFFDIKHVKETLTMAFKKGPNSRRAKSIFILINIVLIHGPACGTVFIWLLSFRVAWRIHFMFIFPTIGEHPVRYLFTRYRFNWDALKYSFYNTFFIVVHAFGAMISITIFSRYLKWHDSVLGIISTCSKLAGTIAVARASTTFDMYLAAVIETFNATSFTAMRSISSKLVTSDELGKMTSLFNLTEILPNMVFGPLYSWLYRETVKLDAATIYYLSAVLIVPPIFIFMWFYVQHKRDIEKEKEILSDETLMNKI